MSAVKKSVVEGVTLRAGGKTTVAMADLYAWVVWQFPRLKPGGHIGAVHPPDANVGWFPAIIQTDGTHVTIYGGNTDHFPTPETAAKALDQLI